MSKNASYRKHNDRTLSSSTYHKKDGTNIRSILKREAEKEIKEETMSLELVKQLRAETGLGIAACKNALEKNDNDPEAAKRWLRENTKVKIVDAQEATEGLIGCYIHHNGQVGAMVYLTAQTDFNARSEEFVKLANYIAMHIAAAKPKYISILDIPEDIRLEEEMTLRHAAKNSGKPDNIIDRMLKGQMKAFFKERCLTEQPFVKDPSTTVGDMIKDLSQKTGESISVRNFTRFEVGMA